MFCERLLLWDGNSFTSNFEVWDMCLLSPACSSSVYMPPALHGHTDTQAPPSGALLFLLFFLILTQGYVYWFYRERKGGRGGEREGKETWSVASYTRSNQGSNPQPRYVPWLGIEPATFWCMGQCANQLSTWPGLLFLLLMLIWATTTFTGGLLS